MTISNGLNRSFFQKQPFHLVNPSHLHTSAVLHSEASQRLVNLTQLNLETETTIRNLELVKYQGLVVNLDDKE